MLPANLAKTRAAGRTAYGELVVLSGGGPTATLGAVGAPTASLRYAPYPIPATITGGGASNSGGGGAVGGAAAHHQHHHQQHHHHHHQPHHQTAHIFPLTASNAPSLLQYAAAAAANPQQSLYDAAAAAISYKRLLAATAAAASLHRSHPAVGAHPSLAHHHHAHRASAATTALAYPLSELLGVQGLDVSALYGLPAATLGL